MQRKERFESVETSREIQEGTKVRGTREWQDERRQETTPRQEMGDSLYARKWNKALKQEVPVFL